ncbi:kinase-like domain-containing protein [Rhizophagus diaphanus]|nr:kinase-like domain-containing protein [Rhizophagus diaphanus] [Rhizophagus sp. MUCL 43196]
MENLPKNLLIEEQFLLDHVQHAQPQSDDTHMFDDNTINSTNNANNDSNKESIGNSGLQPYHHHQDLAEIGNSIIHIPYYFENNLRLEAYHTNRLKLLLDDEISQIIYYYDPQDFKTLDKISTGASTLVYYVCWKNASKFTIKKFVGNSNKEAIVNEIYLTGLVNPHPNIIQFYGVTKLNDEINYSLVLEYAEGGTLEKYLSDNTITFKWESQLKFAIEISSAILWLHVDKEIIHGDLHPENILIQKDTIKLADFGCSCLKGSYNNTEVRGVIPYIDPKFFETQNRSYGLTEKSDIYSLGVLFWELTSRKSPFDFKTKNNNRLEIIEIKSDILKGKREKPISGTNYKFVALYEKCWQHEPDVRPDIRQVISEINNIGFLNISNTNFKIEKIERTEIVTIEKLENEDFDLPSCDDCDINSEKYNS